MRRDMKFDIEHLNLEYINWTLQWGKGRNDQDLRFGQYLDWKYDLQMHLSDRSVGLFYDENVDAVYHTILRTLETNLRYEQKGSSQG